MAACLLVALPQGTVKAKWGMATVLPFVEIAFTVS
jgi:hypothetical protein